MNHIYVPFLFLNLKIKIKNTTSLRWQNGLQD